MSKKNRRKTLSEKETLISRNTYSTDDSKMYIIATIIMFHILPLIFKAFHEEGEALYAMFYLMGNNIFLALTGLIYGLKKGFNFKFPLIMSVLAMLSVIFYNSFAKETAFMFCVIYTIVYTIISFVFTPCGAFVKRAFRL